MRGEPVALVGAQLQRVGDHIARDGIAAIRGICSAAPGCAVVVLAQAHDADYLLECVRAGAVGYVPGALDADRLLRVVRAASNNEAVVPRTMVLELLLELSRPSISPCHRHPPCRHQCRRTHRHR